MFSSIKYALVTLQYPHDYHNNSVQRKLRNHYPTTILTGQNNLEHRHCEITVIVI